MKSWLTALAHLLAILGVGIAVVSVTIVAFGVVEARYRRKRARSAWNYASENDR